MGILKRKGWSSNQPFSGAMFVSGRVSKKTLPRTLIHFFFLVSHTVHLWLFLGLGPWGGVLRRADVDVRWACTLRREDYNVPWRLNIIVFCEEKKVVATQSYSQKTPKRSVYQDPFQKWMDETNPKLSKRMDVLSWLAQESLHHRKRK